MCQISGVYCNGRRRDDIFGLEATILANLCSRISVPVAFKNDFFFLRHASIFTVRIIHCYSLMHEEIEFCCSLFSSIFVSGFIEVNRAFFDTVLSI